jgi:BON domain
MDISLINRVGTSIATNQRSLMKKFIWLIPLLFGLNIVFAGCDERGRQPRTTPSPSTAPSTSKLRDSDLQKAVRAKLETDAQLKEADISVIAIGERNEITLSGTVRSRAAREKAIELAKSAKPGVLVNDQIDVKPAS